MTENIEVVPLGEHDYLVRARYAEGVAEFCFRAGPNLLKQLGVSPADERRLVEHSASYLLAHQPVIDLPPLVDLEDLAAVYDAYLAQMRKAITGP